MELKDSIALKIKARANDAKVCVVGAKNKARNVALMIAGVVMAVALSYSTLNGVTAVGYDFAVQSVETPVEFETKEYKVPLHDPFTFSHVSSNSSIETLETELQELRLWARAEYNSRMKSFDSLFDSEVKKSLIKLQNGKHASLSPLIPHALVKQTRNNLSDMLLRKIEISTENYRAFHGYRNTNSSLSTGVQQTPFYIDEKELALQKILKETTQKVAIFKGKINLDNLDYYIAKLTDDYRNVHGYKLDAVGNPQKLSDKVIKVTNPRPTAKDLELLATYTKMDIAELFEKESDVNKKTIFANLENDEFYLQLALPEIYGTEELHKARSEWDAVNDLSVNEIDERFKAQQDAREGDTNRPG